MLRQAYANECKHILGGKQRAVFKNRPSEFFRNSGGSYFRRIDYKHAIYPCRGLLHPGLGVAPRNPPHRQMGANAPSLSEGAQTDFLIEPFN